MHAHKIVTGVQYHSEHAHDLYLNACSSSTRNLHLEHAQDLYLLGQLNPKELCHTHFFSSKLKHSFFHFISSCVCQMLLLLQRE